ncbi:hypothetical protein ACHAW6_015349 [Cyclotella cf. meneghiniana]
MNQYALRDANKSRLFAANISLRTSHGVAVDLPYPGFSVDDIVVTLTLCSISNQERAVSEILRILKPSTGKLISLEHIFSKADKGLAWKQELMNPLQNS